MQPFNQKQTTPYADRYGEGFGANGDRFQERVNAAMREGAICRQMPFDMSVDYFFAGLNKENEDPKAEQATNNQPKSILKKRTQSSARRY